MSARGRLLCALLACLACVPGVSRQEEKRTPYPAGSHLQWMRTFHTTDNGLTENAVRALAVLKSGAVLASTGDAVLSKVGNRWSEESGPAAVTALAGSSGSMEAYAGAADAVWGRSEGIWRKEEGSPLAVVAFASEPAGAVWALAPSGVWRRDSGWELIHTLDRDMGPARALYPRDREEVYVAAERGLFRLMGKRKYWLSVEVTPDGLLSPDTRALASLGSAQFLVATAGGLNLTNGLRGWYRYTGANGLPVNDLTAIAVAGDGTVWLGSNEGLIRWAGGRWGYFAGKRWLPDNRVTALVASGDGGVWVGTPQGLSEIRTRRLTLEQKADEFQRTIETRKRRYGYVTGMLLSRPGELEGAVQHISDNDGLWTGLYVAAQSFRYAATRSPEARAQAWRSMQALLTLESITGIPGFPARAASHSSEPQFAAQSGRSVSEWHPSPVEKDWWWKGDTSSDEIDGHFFGWQVFYELAATEEQRRQVRATCQRVMNHILDHGYHLIDIDGKPTTWGVWAPEKLNDDPVWWEERGLNSLEILSHLKVAAHIVGDPRYERAYRELIEKHHYALNTIEAKLPGGVSHDDQLLFLAYYPLLQLEHDPALRAIYLAGLRRTWNLERVEANPLWNLIYGASTGEACDVESAVETLREFPLDLITWRMRNSHRADLKYDPNLAVKGIQQLRVPLPWMERPYHKWDGNPFVLDGGNDLGEGDPTVWLLPYWLGRFHLLVE